MEFSEYHDKCICQICKCGNHVCPKPHLKGDFQSSYLVHYPKHEVGPAGSPKKQYKYEPQHYDPNSLKSNYQDQFVRGSTEMPQRAHGPNVNNEVIPKGDFQGSSAYQNHFTQFQGKYSQLRANILRERGGLPNVPFQGESTYNINHTGARTERPEKFVVKNNLQTGGQFDGETTYGRNYTEKPKTVLSSPERPKSQKDLIGIGDFNGLSSYNAHYVPVQSGKGQKFVPRNELSVGNYQFEGASSYNASYKGQRIQPRAPAAAPPSNMILPEGGFQGNSTYAVHYLNNQSLGGRQASMKPKDTPITSGQFKGSSTYADHYIPAYVQKVGCPVLKLKAPNYNPLDQQHMKFNANLKLWV